MNRNREDILVTILSDVLPTPSAVNNIIIDYQISREKWCEFKIGTPMIGVNCIDFMPVGDTGMYLSFNRFKNKY